MVKSTNKYIQKSKRKKKIKKVLFLAVLTAIILVGVAYKSTLFNIKQFKVTGEKNYTEENILSLVSGLKGENIFLVSSGEIEKSLKEVPYVDSVKVEKKYPNTLVFQVNEKDAAYYIDNGGEYLILSDDLHIIDKLYDLSIPNLMDIKGINIESQEIGKPIKEIDDRTKKVLNSFYKINSLEKVVRKITTLDLSNLNDIKVSIGEIQCLLGSDEKIIEKMEFVFDALSEKNSVVTKGYIDIRSLGSPIIMTE